MEYHRKYPTHGYRWLNAKLRLDTDAYKCCRPVGIRSQSKHERYKKLGETRKVYPNLMLSVIAIDQPLQCVVSDMTAFRVKGVYYELTLYMDLWNNEIFSHCLSSKRGDRMTYISGLRDVVSLKKEHPEYTMVLYSDQGCVYASGKYNKCQSSFGILRSMSCAGTPTDNAAMELIHGWINSELFTDFHIVGKNGKKEMEEYIKFLMRRGRLIP